MDVQKSFTIKFENDKLISADGDFELSENFNIPFNTPIPKGDEESLPVTNSSS